MLHFLHIQIVSFAHYARLFTSWVYFKISEALRRQILLWLGVPPDYFANIGAAVEHAALGSVELTTAAMSTDGVSPTVIEALLSATSLVDHSVAPVIDALPSASSVAGHVVTSTAHSLPPL